MLILSKILKVILIIDHNEADKSLILRTTIFLFQEISQFLGDTGMHANYLYKSVFIENSTYKMNYMYHVYIVIIKD